MKLTDEELRVIESLELTEFNLGRHSYSFKKVEIFSPQQNISGLIRIKDTYFQKIYLSEAQGVIQGVSKNKNSLINKNPLI